MMKWIIATGALFLAFQVSAADRKIGNMIAVERELTDFYQTCLDNMSKGDGNGPGQIFSCSIPATYNPAEFIVGDKPILRLSDENCLVEGQIANNKILVLFYNVKKDGNFAEAKLCLQKAVAMKSTYKYIVYSVE